MAEATPPPSASPDMAPPESRAKPPHAFTLRQRRGIVLFCGLLIVITAIGLLRDRAYVADPIPNSALRYLELQDRIDPNTAEASELAALPALGTRRAADIVAFRERMRQTDPDRVVFRRIEDLMQVKGLGKAITDTLRPYLTFPEPPTSAPAPPP